MSEFEVVGRQCFPSDEMKATPNYRQAPWIDDAVGETPSRPGFYRIENLIRESDAQTELAALREELAITQRQATANWKLVESVREELADARLCRSVAEGEWMEALTAAKQRNADHELALMYVRSQITDARLIAYIDKAIKSTESGASE